MQIQLRFKSQTHDISLPTDARVSLLMKEIATKLAVPPEQQKIIFKGKPLGTNDDPLSSLNIANGAKLLLLAQAAVAASSSPSTSSRSQIRRPNRYLPAINDSMDYDPHASIIKQGIPEGAIASYPSQTSVLPSAPFAIYYQSGVKSQLSIESDALFIQGSDGTCERIFFTDIFNVGAVPLTGQNSGYFSLGLQTSLGMRWVYFLPMQYKNCIVGLLQNVN